MNATGEIYVYCFSELLEVLPYEIYRLPPLPPTPNNFDELMFGWIDDEGYGIPGAYRLRFGNQEAWKLGNLEVWRLGGLGAWGGLQISGIQDFRKIRNLEIGGLMVWWLDGMRNFGGLVVWWFGVHGLVWFCFVI